MLITSLKGFLHSNVHLNFFKILNTLKNGRWHLLAIEMNVTHPVSHCNSLVILNENMSSMD